MWSVTFGKIEPIRELCPTKKKLHKTIDLALAAGFQEIKIKVEPKPVKNDTKASN